jgi:hypothetical protein
VAVVVAAANCGEVVGLGVVGVAIAGGVVGAAVVVEAVVAATITGIVVVVVVVVGVANRGAGCAPTVAVTTSTPAAVATASVNSRRIMTSRCHRRHWSGTGLTGTSVPRLALPRSIASHVTGPRAAR